MAQLQSTTLTGTFTTTGNVGIGTTSVDSYRLNIAGNTNIAGTLTATSISMGGNTVLTTGNYSSYALPLSGGTMSGIITTVSSGTAINFSGQSDSFGYNATSGLGTYIKGTGSTYIYGGGSFYDGSAQRVILHAGNYNSYAAPAASFKALGTNVSYDVDRTVKTSGGGLAVYTGYSSGANRPFTYDIAAQFASANGIAFEIAADWINTNSTPLRVRSLRDCCQNWSSWSAIATSNESFTNNVDLRAPIFYDSDNTGYYLNPASSSVLRNIMIYPFASSWAEGVAFSMSSTSTWGGLRWRRERAGNDGNWYIGYTALDSSDDLVFGANNGG